MAKIDIFNQFDSILNPLRCIKCLLIKEGELRILSSCSHLYCSSCLKSLKRRREDGKDLLECESCQMLSLEEKCKEVNEEVTEKIQIAKFIMAHYNEPDEIAKFKKLHCKTISKEKKSLVGKKIKESSSIKINNTLLSGKPCCVCFCPHDANLNVKIQDIGAELGFPIIREGIDSKLGLCKTCASNYSTLKGLRESQIETEKELIELREKSNKIKIVQSKRINEASNTSSQLGYKQYGGGKRRPRGLCYVCQIPFERRAKKAWYFLSSKLPFDDLEINKTVWDAIRAIKLTTKNLSLPLIPQPDENGDERQICGPCRARLITSLDFLPLSIMKKTKTHLLN